MLRPQGGLWTPWKCIKVLHVSVYVHFFSWRPLVLHHVLKGISDPEDAENCWMIIKSKLVHTAQHLHGKQASLFSLMTHPIRNLSSKRYASRGPLRFMCWTIRVSWLSLKKLPTDNIITSLSYRAEPLYDPKHIFSKKWWAYLCPTFAHTHYPLQGW